MKPPASPTLLEHASEWDELSRWERAELGRALRTLGWSYAEIMDLIPVPKGTLSYWCRSIELPQEQKAAIRTRTGSWKGVPRDTQRKRREQVERICLEATKRARILCADPLWVAGTALYWGEGGKSKRMLSLTNADPRVLQIFIAWVREHHDPNAEFVLSLHLHEGNDEQAAKAHWAAVLDLPHVDFYKTFVKPSGTGHRKNRLPFGICRVLVRRSTDAWHRTMAWIDALAVLGLEEGNVKRLSSSPLGR